VPGRSGKLCGAWAKARGRPCQAKAINATGRCRVHGGVVVLRSPEGVRRAVEARNAQLARWREEMGLPPWWRVRLVHMSAGAWLAKQRAQQQAEAETP
jgi:hypothetical protein